MDLRGYIVILKKDGAPGPFCDWRAEKCVFGSDPSCDVNINLTDIDPVHCTLQVLQDGRVMAESHVKPASRTLLNGKPVVSRTFVPHNSILTVGERNFKFLYPENSKWISTFRQSPRSTKTEARFRSVTTPVIDVESFPVVRSKSPKPSFPQPLVKRTPTASPSRRPLTTRERYGPTPPRPVTPAPVVEVKRHASRSSLKPRRSSAGSRYSTTSPALSRKKAKVLLLTNTPTSGPQSIRRTARQQKTPVSTQANNSSITSSYSMLGLKSPNYLNQSSYTSAFLDDPSYDASYDPSTADVLSPAAQYFSLQKKGNSASYAKFPFTEPRQRTYVSRTPIPRRQSLPRNRSMLSPKGSDSTPIPARNRSSSSPASSGLSVRSGNAATPPASNNAATPFLLHGSPKSAATDKANMPRVPSPYPSHAAVRTPLTEKSSVLGRSAVSSTKVNPSQLEISLSSGKRHSISLEKLSLVSATKDSSNKDLGAKQIPKSKSKAVKFGPALSPEQFDSSLPPATPVRRGAIPLMHSSRGRASVVSNRNIDHAEIPSSDVLTPSSPVHTSGKRLSSRYPSTATKVTLNLEETRRSLSVPAAGAQIRSPARTENISARNSPGMASRYSTLLVSSPGHQQRSDISLVETHMETALPMSSTGRSDISISDASKSQHSPRELSTFSLVSPTQVVSESPQASLRKQDSGPRTSTQQNASNRLSAPSTPHVPLNLKMNDPESLSSLKRMKNSDVYGDGVSSVKLPRLSGRRVVTTSLTPRKPLRTSSPVVSEPRMVGRLSRVSHVLKSKVPISPGPASPDDILMSQTPRTLPRTGRRSKLSMRSKYRRSTSVSDLLNSDTGRDISQLSAGTLEEANFSRLGALEALSASRASRGSSRVSTTERRLQTHKLVRLSASVEPESPSLAEETLKSPTPRKYSRSSVRSQKSVALTTPRSNGLEKASAGRGVNDQASVTDLDVQESPVSNAPGDILFSPTPEKYKPPSDSDKTSNVLSAAKSVQQKIKKSSLTAASLFSLHRSTSSATKTRKSTQLLAFHDAPNTRLSSTGRKSKTNASIKFGSRSMLSESASLSHFEEKLMSSSSQKPVRVSTSSRKSGTLSSESLTPRSVSRASGAYMRLTSQFSPDLSVFRNQPTSAASSPKVYGVHAMTPRSVPTTPNWGLTSDVFGASESPKTVESRSTPPLSSVYKPPSTLKTRRSQPYTRIARHGIMPVSEQRPRISNSENIMRTRRPIHSLSLSGVLKSPVAPRTSKVSLVKTPPLSTPGFASAKKIERSQYQTPTTALSIRKMPRSVRSQPSWLADNQTPAETQMLKGTSRLSSKQNPITNSESQPSLDSPELSTSPVSKPSPKSLTPRGHVRTPQSQPSPRLTGIRKLIKLPTTSQTPKVSAVRRFMKSPKSELSPQLTGVRELLKTPTEKRSPRISAVRTLVTTPKSQRSPTMTDVQKLLQMPTPKQTPRMSGIAKLVRTPNSQRSLRLTGVGKLKETTTPKRTRRVSAAPRLMKTPEYQPTPRITDVKELARAPTPKRTPRMSTVREIGKTPKSHRSPRLTGVGKLMETPSSKRTPRMSSVRKLVTTPKSQRSPRLTGVRKLMKTPKPKRTPRISAVRKLVKTPKSQRSPRLTGIGKLMETPTPTRTPRVSAALRLMKTPEYQPSPRITDVQELARTPTPKQTPRMSTVRGIGKTPKSQRSPRLTGVRKLMKTPKPKRTPRMSDIRKLVKTPKSRPSPRLMGVRNLLKTPKSQPSPRLAGVRELMKTPKLQRSPQLLGVSELTKTPSSALIPLPDNNVFEATEFTRSLPVLSPKQSVKSLRTRKLPLAEENMTVFVIQGSTKRPRLRRGRGLQVHTVQSPKPPTPKKSRSPTKSRALRRTPRLPTKASKSRQASKTTPKRSGLSSVKATSGLPPPTTLSSHPSHSNGLALPSPRRGRVHPPTMAKKTRAKPVSTPLIKASLKPVRSTRGRQTKVNSVEKTTRLPVNEALSVSPPARKAQPKRILRGKTKVPRQAASGTVVASPGIKFAEEPINSLSKPTTALKRTAPKRAVGGKKKTIMVEKTSGAAATKPAPVSPLVNKATPKRVLRGKPLSSSVVNSNKKPVNRRAARKQTVQRKLSQSPKHIVNFNSQVKSAGPKQAVSKSGAPVPSAKSVKVFINVGESNSLAGKLELKRASPPEVVLPFVTYPSDAGNALSQGSLSTRKRNLRLRARGSAQEESVSKADQKVGVTQSKTIRESAKQDNLSSTTPNTPHITGTRKRRLLTSAIVEEISPPKVPKKINRRRAAMSKAKAAPSTKKSSGSPRQPSKVNRSKAATSSEVVASISTRRTRSQKK